MSNPITPTFGATLALYGSVASPAALEALRQSRAAARMQAQAKAGVALQRLVAELKAMNTADDVIGKSRTTR